jgi:hypothetical protein
MLLLNRLLRTKHSMTKKPARKHDDPEQSKRFVEAAKEVGAAETEKGADNAFKKVAAPPKPKSEKSS